jgi:hypothetical protein
MEKHGDVMEVAKLGSSIYPLQAIEAEKPGVIIEDRVQ